MTNIEILKQAIDTSLEFPEHPDRGSMISTGQSLTPLIYNIVKLMRPPCCFEWGPGQSSHAFLMGDGSLNLISYEHDPHWAQAAKNSLDHEDYSHRFTVFTEEDEHKYITTIFPDSSFDIVLVDGVYRPECLREAHRLVLKSGIVLAHDWQSDALWPSRETELSFYGLYHDPIQPIETVAIFIK